MANDQVHIEDHDGTKKVLAEKRTFCVHFHHFANLKHDRGDYVASARLSCHGHEWCLTLYPGGTRESKENRIALALAILNLDVDERVVAVPFLKTNHSDHPGLNKSKKEYVLHGRVNGWTFPNALKRSKILDPSNTYLVDGTLTIKVELQIYTDKPEFWMPPPSWKSDNLAMFHSGECADVSFKVQSKTFKAHRFVLCQRAPVLASLSENADKDKSIEIEGVVPDTFYSLLYFVYSHELPQDDEDLKQNARELLTVADMFGCVSLKMVVEAHLASSGISVDTAADLFLLADSKNCAMLKEAIVNFFLSHGDEVVKSEGYSRLKESPTLLSELLESTCRRRGANDGDESSAMTVSNLRKRLHDGGKDIDGTKEVLVKRFKSMN